MSEEDLKPPPESIPSVPTASELAAQAIQAEISALPTSFAAAATSNDDELIVPPTTAEATATTRTSLKLLTMGREGAKKAAQGAIPERFGGESRMVSFGFGTTTCAKANQDLYERVLAYDQQMNITAHTTIVHTEPLQPLWRLVIFEYLRMMDRLNHDAFGAVYQKVLDALMSSESNLKTVVTVDLWERALKYIEDYQVYQAIQSVGNTSTQLPILFQDTDWPETTASGNQFAVVRVTESGGIQMDRVDLNDMMVQSDEETTKALGAALQNRPLEEVTDGRLHWNTFHVTRLTAENQELLASGADLPAITAGRPNHVESGSRNVSIESTNPDGKRRHSSISKPSSRKARHAMIPQNKRKYINGDPLELDVKFGRGGGTNNHKGNVLYLLKKLSMQPAYALLATSRGKTIISMQLVAAVQEWGGRFVARADNGMWFEVDLATARRKASQTLREDKTPLEQEQKRALLQRKLDELESATNPSHKRRKTSMLEKAAGETLLRLQTPAAAGMKQESGGEEMAEV